MAAIVVISSRALYVLATPALLFMTVSRGDMALGYKAPGYKDYLHVINMGQAGAVLYHSREQGSVHQNQSTSMAE